MVRNSNYPCRFGEPFGLSPHLIALLWVLGLLSGAWTSARVGSSVYSLMHAALVCRMSIVGTALAIFLPLIFTGVAVFVSSRFVLSILAFIKAYLFSFCAGCLSCVFGDASWLVQFFFLFTDALTAVPLLWLWFSILRCNNNSAGVSYFLVCVFSALVGYLDYSAVSPFLAELFK